jgi:flavin-dependent dehydrogenase
MDTFTGTIRAPLLALNVWSTFEQAGHVRGYQRESAWGGEPQAETSIIRPHGPLWHVDRTRFDQDLRIAVLRRTGDILVPYLKLDFVTRQTNTWQVGIDGGTLRAKYLVDATGRSRVLARRLNATVMVHDRLLGLTSYVSREETTADIRSMLIEATPFGWWYAAPTPKGHVLALFTDSDLAPPDVRRRLRPVAANSAFTHMKASQGWLPVGDACASHDPLCGWGVHRAITNGLQAADAIEAFLAKGDLSGIEDYRQHCSRQYESYLEGLAKHYSTEKRWPSAPFWQRRHNHSAIASA